MASLNFLGAIVFKKCREQKLAFKNTHTSFEKNIKYKIKKISENQIEKVKNIFSLDFHWTATVVQKHLCFISC